MKPKKILFVITKSNWGGAQNYVYSLATHALKHGYSVAVACGGTGEPNAKTGLLEEKLHKAGIRTITVQSFMRDISLMRDIRALLELMKIMRREQPDIVHLNSSKAGGLGALAARITRIPTIVFTAHGWPFWEQRSLPAKICMYFLSWLTALLSTKVITVSKYDQSVATHMFGISHKIFHIYNGIDFNTKLGDGTCIRKIFPEGAHITGTIGETNKNKNHISLIEEARKNPDMYVAIVGVDGEERPNLEKAIVHYDLSNRVKLLGFIPWHDALPGFDEFVLPSLKEGLPTVLIEARFAGLPIRANRAIGGIREILDTPDIQVFSEDHMRRKTFELYELNGSVTA